MTKSSKTKGAVAHSVARPLQTKDLSSPLTTITRLGLFAAFYVGTAIIVSLVGIGMATSFVRWLTT